MEFAVCEVAKKEDAIVQALVSKELRQENFDVPLILFGGTISAFILFEEPKNGLASAGLATGLLTSLRNYFDVPNVRKSLYAGVTGFGCLSDQGQKALFEVQQLETAADLVDAPLRQAVLQLRRDLNKPPNGFDKTRGQSVLNHAEAALDLYTAQKKTLSDLVPNYRGAARKLSVSLLQATERDSVDVGAVVSAIRAQVDAVSEYEAGQEAADTGEPVNNEQQEDALRQEQGPGLSGNENTEYLADLIALVVQSTPNLKGTLASFDVCVAEAVTEGS
ncbi:MAG: hypothetical protein AAGH41_03850 [Pseudomonadota bacterium]